VPEDQRYEVITSVIEEADGPRLCFNVLDSLPPRCGTGLVLNDWSWDDIGVEQVRNDVTWVDSIYVTGTYDEAAQAFTVDGAGIPSDADRERLMRSLPMPDLSVPCPTPSGGWPSSTGVEWPADKIAAIDGYAGSWRDEGQQVMTVKFTGDVTAAEAAVRQLYSDPLCVISAERSEAELTAIHGQLLAMSSVQLLDAWVHVDASGEWIGAHTIAPDAVRQSAFDAEFGQGVVRLEPVLHPLA